MTLAAVRFDAFRGRRPSRPASHRVWSPCSPQCVESSSEPFSVALRQGRTARRGSRVGIPDTNDDPILWGIGHPFRRVRRRGSRRSTRRPWCDRPRKSRSSATRSRATGSGGGGSGAGAPGNGTPGARGRTRPRAGARRSPRPTAGERPERGSDIVSTEPLRLHAATRGGAGPGRGRTLIEEAAGS